jgi:hypothetical protein
MFHCVPPAQSYEQGPEQERLDEALRQRGVAALEELMTRGPKWRIWQARPPWGGRRPADDG